jgi:catechol 2,3-dioxygenase-like lactoylglutathione lyase family enzyme
MAVRVGSIVLGASDVPRAVRFWCRALGYRPREEPDDTWAVLTPVSGGGPNVSIALSDTPAQDRPRVHVDLYADDQPTTVERLVGLGASRVDWPDYPEGADFVVLADPEGNRFCVIDKGG